MTIEDRLEELKQEVGNVKEIAEDNQRMLKVICETLGTQESERWFGPQEYTSTHVPLRERLDLLIEKTVKEDGR